jgi:hypothetical protein
MAVLNSTGMLTSPNVSEPFQIAAIRASSPESAHASRCLRANQMPSCNSSIVMPDAKKPRWAGLFVGEWIGQLALVTSAACGPF